MTPAELDLKPYVGLWIAIVRGRVVASGHTAYETLMHCRAARLKDEPILKYTPPPTNAVVTKK